MPLTDRKPPRALNALIPLLALAATELNVLCNPFSAAELFHLLRAERAGTVAPPDSEPHTAARRAQVGTPRTRDASGPQVALPPQFSVPPQIDDVVALPAKAALADPHCYIIYIYDDLICMQRFAASLRAWEPFKPESSHQTSARLCRLRC
jgi:hypothetical protein